MEFANVQNLTMTIIYSWLVVYELMSLLEGGLNGDKSFKDIEDKNITEGWECFRLKNTK